ncbi:cysteine-rich receptor-like protein kinase [Tanacetum coccineum]
MLDYTSSQLSFWDDLGFTITTLLTIRFSARTINTWDLLEKAFIQRYCPPSKTAKQLEDIYNFKQEGDESLYQSWEWYNDLLYKCPTHEINIHQKGPIPGMTLAQALIAIQTMADYSQKWHDGTTSRIIGSSSSNNRLAALVNKLDNLGRDMKKLKESVHAIQVGCQICEGPHLDKDCPLNEEVKQVEEVRYGEFGRTTLFNRINGERQFLAETIKKYIEEASVRQVKQDEWLKTFCHNLEKKPKPP